MRKIFLTTVAAVLCFGVFESVAATVEPLTISYFDRPPYYVKTFQGDPRGFLMTLAQRIFAQAGVAVRYRELPPARILLELKDRSDAPQCSVGWFRNTEREIYARFTLPIYRDRPLEVLARKSAMTAVRRHQSLRQLFMDHNLVMARISSFSYGDRVDRLINELHPRMFEVAQKQDLLPLLIAAKRADYMLIAPEEVQTLIAESQLKNDDFGQMALPDLPEGNLRYIMCSRGVDTEILARLNAAILKLRGSDALVP